MKKTNFIPTLLLATLLSFGVSACGSNDSPIQESNDIHIIEKDDETHFLRFMENNAEILRMVVLENETYDELLPYFPTLTEEPGYIKYWDGDYTYTDYSFENQFNVYSSSTMSIDIYAYMKKA